MKKCPKCAEDVQDEAKVCRFCGHKFSQVPQIGCAAMLLIGIAILFIVVVLTPNDPEREAKDARELAAVTEALRIEGVVKSRLRDPDSAEFTHINAKCGYVNSRNGFGGMSGDTPFIVNGNAALLQSDAPKDFEKLWASNCT